MLIFELQIADAGLGFWKQLLDIGDGNRSTTEIENIPVTKELCIKEGWLHISLAIEVVTDPLPENKIAVVLSTAFYSLFRNTLQQEIEMQWDAKAVFHGIVNTNDLLTGYKPVFRNMGLEVNIKRYGAVTADMYTCTLSGKISFYRLIAGLYHFILYRTGIKDAHSIRHEVIAQEVFLLRSAGIADLGCGDGRFIRYLLMEKPAISRQIKYIRGLEVDKIAFAAAIENLATYQGNCEVEILNADITRNMVNRTGIDTVVLVEVIEHLNSIQLDDLAEVVFTEWCPQYVFVSTPNADYNVFITNILPNGLRHSDHIFEWNKPSFIKWGTAIREKYGYIPSYIPLGHVAPNNAAISHMLVFKRG